MIIVGKISLEDSNLLADLTSRQPVDYEDFVQYARQAAVSASERHPIGEFVCFLSFERAHLPLTNRTLPIYRDGSAAESEEVSWRLSYTVGGIAECSFRVSPYPQPEEEEFWRCFCTLLSYTLGTLATNEAMGVMLTTDIEVGVPNIDGLMRYAVRLIGENRIGGYNALYINIRNFGSVQKLPYMHGNRILALYCRKLTSMIQNDEMISRLGEDNFIALITVENTGSFLKQLQGVELDYFYDGETYTFNFGATVGVADLKGIQDVSEIMVRVTAAYQAARKGGIPVSFYDHSLHERILRSKFMLAMFSEALAGGEFLVYYQPKVETSNWRLIGAEALVRWKREGRLISPGEFIPAFEEDGCICELDFHVLREVCRFIGKVQEMGMEPVKISVNFSKKHLSNSNLAEDIAGMIDSFGVPRKYIEIEMTESRDFREVDVMQKLLQGLSELGLETSIDDFGTGYSSLSMLHRMNFDVLKIDRSFIPAGKIEDNGKDVVMLKSIVNLAKNMGMKTIAEGVETATQLSLLETVGCDMIQGFVFDRPLEEEAFLKRLADPEYYLCSLGGESTKA